MVLRSAWGVSVLLCLRCLRVGHVSLFLVLYHWFPCPVFISLLSLSRFYMAALVVLVSIVVLFIFSCFLCCVNPHYYRCICLVLSVAFLRRCLDCFVLCVSVFIPVLGRT